MSVERIGRKTSPPFSSFRFHSHPLIPTCTTHYCSGMEGRQNGSHPRLFRQGVTERMSKNPPPLIGRLLEVPRIFNPEAEKEVDDFMGHAYEAAHRVVSATDPVDRDKYAGHRWERQKRSPIGLLSNETKGRA